MKNCKKLFTPGPLNTSSNVRSAMNVDIGTRTKTIVDLTRNIREGIENIAGCGDAYTAVLLQGSGTFAVEAMLTSLIHPSDFVLIVSNGVYANRMAHICQIHNIQHCILESSHTIPINIKDVQEFLNKEKRITHIAAVQFETTVGVLNDIDALTLLAAKYDCEVLVDAMSSFGALPLNYIPSLIAVASSSNKCLHGAPGVGFVIAHKEKLLRKNKARTLSLNLKEQWMEFEKSGQWRFTPPTHVLLALQTAIEEFKKAGSTEARLKKYSQLANELISGFAKMDIHPVLKDIYRSNMIITFALGNTHSVEAKSLYEELFDQGYVIYPSDLVPNKSFRVGCIGDIDIKDINALIKAVKNIVSREKT